MPSLPAPSRGRTDRAWPHRRTGPTDRATTIEALMLSGARSLEIPAEERVCRECGREFLASYAIQQVCPRCVEEHVRQDATQLREARAENERRRRAALGLTGRLAGMALRNFESAIQPEAAAAVAEFVADYPNRAALALLGIPGAGKTHLAVGALQELVWSQGIAARYVHLPTLTADLRMAPDWQAAASASLAPLLKIDLLVLDDIGRERQTPSLPEMIDVLFNARWVGGYPTILTANLERSAFADWLGPAAASRFFSEARVIRLQDVDYRLERRGRQTAPVAAGDPAIVCPICQGAGWVLNPTYAPMHPNRATKCDACKGRGF